ncbi:minor capsid protein [Sporosarcina psychrophila]|uniref:minor capsid protein n=1 Tax=Sporosarcina psychrophila TaxID=1476 RepID=UPI00078C11CF|nr:minor capsid protein [Sporosarcina psychrophila]AMQ06732.1 capsid protein [Sporosarcina psychrophila]
MTRVTINLDGVKARISQEAMNRGRYALANQAMADMDQFIPMLSGALRMTATIDIDGGGINYNTPYSNKLFYMYMHNYTTPGTGPRWDLKAKGAFMSDWINAFTRGAGL